MMGQRTRSFSLLFFFVIFLLAGVALAKEIPVNIKADKLKYIEGTSLIEATGSVEVKIKEMTIYADFLRLDSDTNIATAEGNVKMVSQTYQARAGQMIYDANKGFSSFDNFSSRVKTSKLRGELFLSAKQINDLEEKMLGQQGAVTSCDYDLAHYVTAAERVEYYPKDKIVGYNVTLFIGRLPVFWLPYMVYDLKEQDKRNWIIGHNDVEGDYFKSAWVYPLGVLYLDLMEKKGFGTGTHTGYNFPALGFGSLYLYHLKEKDTGLRDWVTRINHTKNINPATTLKLEQAYTATYLIPSGRSDQTNLGLSLSYKDKARWNLALHSFDDRVGQQQKYAFQFDQAYEAITTDYGFNYDYLKKDPQWIRASQRFSHRRPLWSNQVFLTTRANYYNNVAAGGQPGDERLEPVVEIVGREKGYSFRLSQNWYFDLDSDKFTADADYQYLEKQPELEVSLNPLTLPIFTLSPKFGYGQYHEVRYVPALGRNRDYTSQRYQTTFDLDRSIPCPLGTVALFSAGLDQFFYTPGDQLYAYREKMSLQTNLGNFFRNSFGYQKGSTDGNTPFLFDQLGKNYHSVNEELMLYYLNKFRLTLTGGRNWQTHKWFDVLGNLFLRPNEGINWNARTGWDIENRIYKDLINTLTLTPYSFLNLSFQTVSDLNVGGLKSGSILYRLLLLEKQPNQWQFSCSQVFEPGTQQFKVRDIMVIKDLHCWQLKYNYSDFRKEFSLGFSLKAMQDELVSFSSEGGLKMETFEKELQDLKREGAVRRY